MREETPTYAQVLLAPAPGRVKYSPNNLFQLSEDKIGAKTAPFGAKTSPFGDNNFQFTEFANIRL